MQLYQMCIIFAQSCSKKNPPLLCQVDETTEREEGWLYGSKQGKMGWFPESYVERVAPSGTVNNAAAAAAATPVKLPLQAQLSNALEAAKSAFTPTHSPNPAPSDTQGQVRGPQRSMVLHSSLCCFQHTDKPELYTPSALPLSRWWATCWPRLCARGRPRQTTT